MMIVLSLGPQQHCITRVFMCMKMKHLEQHCLFSTQLLKEESYF